MHLQRIHVHRYVSLPECIFWQTANLKKHEQSPFFQPPPQQKKSPKTQKIQPHNVLPFIIFFCVSTSSKQRIAGGRLLNSWRAASFASASDQKPRLSGWRQTQPPMEVPSENCENFTALKKKNILWHLKNIQKFLDPVGFWFWEFPVKSNRQIFLLHENNLKQLVIIAILDTCLSTYTNINLYDMICKYNHIYSFTILKNLPRKRTVRRQQQKKHNWQTWVVNQWPPPLPLLPSFCWSSGPRPQPPRIPSLWEWP